MAPSASSSVDAGTTAADTLTDTAAAQPPAPAPAPAPAPTPAPVPAAQAQAQGKGHGGGRKKKALQGADSDSESESEEEEQEVDYVERSPKGNYVRVRCIALQCRSVAPDLLIYWAVWERAEFPYARRPICRFLVPSRPSDPNPRGSCSALAVPYRVTSDALHAAGVDNLHLHLHPYLCLDLS